ncbi:hypothetical protein K488DRAFT_81435 [Vararia minispora EC-137]|uniref:Uncharacterized protein n=1 Tax=Vararia minispora EC-137 TaxID=1314806 RepID=A0ACB8QZX1_9AGAM|nr:hypothetical protein K488DRAFT_81435 [Vararia minispora EC-137]
MSSSSDSSLRRLPRRSDKGDPERRSAVKKAKKAEVIRARQMWFETCQRHKPYKWIGRAMLPSDTNKPPLLHYGIGLKVEPMYKGESLVRYAKEKSIYKDLVASDGSLNTGATVYLAMDRAVQYLCFELSYELEVILPYSTKYDVIIAIYTNWDVGRDLMPPRRAKEVVNAIQQAVGDLEQIPLWYHDRTEHDGDYALLPRSRPFPKPTLPPAGPGCPAPEVTDIHPALHTTPPSEQPEQA